MTIDKDLEARLQKLAPNARTGKIVIETAAVSDVSAYLAAEKIRHCSLPKCGKVIVGFANYQEMAKLDSTYPVQITRILPDARGTNALAKLDSSFSFNPWFRLGGNAPERDVYDVKDEGVSGLVQHTARFDGSAYKISKCCDTISSFDGTFEQLFAIALDGEVTYVEASKMMQLHRG